MLESSTCDRLLNPLRPMCGLAALAAATAWAQIAPPPPPPPLPGARRCPRARPARTRATPTEPQVTIIRRETETLEEVRIGGELKFIKVTPRHGRPYYLVPDGGPNTYIRRDEPRHVAQGADVGAVLVVSRRARRA